MYYVKHKTCFISFYFPRYISVPVEYGMLDRFHLMFLYVPTFSLVGVIFIVLGHLNSCFALLLPSSSLTPITGCDSRSHPAHCSSGAGAEPLVMYSRWRHHHEYPWFLPGSSGKPRILPSWQQLLGPLCGGRLPLSKVCGGDLWESSVRFHQLASNWDSPRLRDPTSSTLGISNAWGPVWKRPASSHRFLTICDTWWHCPGSKTTPVGPIWQFMATQPSASRDSSPAGLRSGRLWLPFLVPQDSQGHMQVKPCTESPFCKPAHQCHTTHDPGRGDWLVTRCDCWPFSAGIERTDWLLGGWGSSQCSESKGELVFRAHSWRSGWIGLYSVQFSFRTRGLAADIIAALCVKMVLELPVNYRFSMTPPEWYMRTQPVLWQAHPFFLSILGGGGLLDFLVLLVQFHKLHSSSLMGKGEMWNCCSEMIINVRTICLPQQCTPHSFGLLFSYFSTAKTVTPTLAIVELGH